MKHGGGVLLAVVLVVCASLGRWNMEGLPAKRWRGEAPKPSFEYCPDGLCSQIHLFAGMIRGEPDGAARYLHWIRRSHQSSTLLVDVLAGSLSAAGIPPVGAFIVVSTLASLGLVLLLHRLLGELFPENAGARTFGLCCFLMHPATLRCFTRPQTDALMAFFALACVFLVRRAATRATPGLWALLVLSQSAACFVKIHALWLLGLAPLVAWMHGCRGRLLFRVLAFSCVIPAIVWISVFHGLELFPTIGNAWNYKGAFYGQFTGSVILALVLATILPLLFLAARRISRTPSWAWMLVAGFAGILVVSRIPPLVRFQYPMLAPLVVIAVTGLMAGVQRPPRWAWMVPGWFAAISLSLVAIQLYRSFIGPTRDWSPVDGWLVFLL